LSYGRQVISKCLQFNGFALTSSIPFWLVHFAGQKRDTGIFFYKIS